MPPFIVAFKTALSNSFLFESTFFSFKLYTNGFLISNVTCLFPFTHPTLTLTQDFASSSVTGVCGFTFTIETLV